VDPTLLEDCIFSQLYVQQICIVVKHIGLHFGGRVVTVGYYDEYQTATSFYYYYYFSLFHLSKLLALVGCLLSCFWVYCLSLKFLLLCKLVQVHILLCYVDVRVKWHSLHLGRKLRDSPNFI